jgi:HEAT repeat protein
VALATIAKFLKSKNLETRVQAVGALGALGKHAKSKLPNIIIMLDDKETAAVAAAALALVSMHDKSDRVIDALISLAGHKEKQKAAWGIVGLVGLKSYKGENNAWVGRAVLALEKLIEKEQAKPKKEVNGDLIELLKKAIDLLNKKDKKVAEAPKKIEKVEKVKERKRRP